MAGTSGSESAWLEQLVGQWDVTFEMADHPAWREETRAVGGGWILAETRGPIEGGSEASMVMMLGYDPARKSYVGATVVSMMSNLWVYEGMLDDTGKVLTLTCEGPDLGDPDRVALYQDIITIIDANTRKFSSITQTPDGTWKHVMASEYKRRPAV